MADATSAHNDSCGDVEHGKHLCFLMYEGYHLNNREGYKELVRDAEFRCQQLGRTAGSGNGLCDPVQL